MPVETSGVLSTLNSQLSTKDDRLIDVHSAPGGLDELVTRLEGLGATRVHEVNKGPAGHWWVMRDPEGNEFSAA